jgi:acyl dehydratase
MNKTNDIPARTFRINRADLVRYAAASGDLNPIHWSDRIAAAKELPGVIAHGMFTMALAAQALLEWAGDPAAMIEYEARFSKPVVVPDDDVGVEVVVSGTVLEHTDDGHTRVEVSVVCSGERVLGRGAVATLRHATEPAEQDGARGRLPRVVTQT